MTVAASPTAVGQVRFLPTRSNRDREPISQSLNGDHVTKPCLVDQNGIRRNLEVFPDLSAHPTCALTHRYPPLPHTQNPMYDNSNKPMWVKLYHHVYNLRRDQGLPQGGHKD